MKRCKRPPFLPALSLLALGALSPYFGCAHQENPDSVADLAAPTADLAPALVPERTLAVDLSLSGTTLHIAVHDGATPVMTDVWLYTIEGGVPTPITAFTDPPTKRRSRRLMMPCTLAGVPSGLVPCNDGVANGVMTDLVRETLANGVYTPAIKGVVDVVLTTAPTSPVLVVAAVEDERYAGAAAIGLDGKPVAVPQGLGVPQSHRARSYTQDVAPIIQSSCIGCHNSAGVAPLHLLNSYSDVVLRNFAFYESQARCQQKYPMDATAEQACEKAITQVEYMIERGAPAASGLAQRCRPDDLKSVSPEGLLWYGFGSSRFGRDGDNRMPSTTTTPVTDMGQPPALPTYFDEHPADYQIIFDWIAQGAPQ